MYRNDFPIFETFKGTYLDTAASSQKPKAVLDAMDEFYKTSYANIHRGIYSLSENATNRYEQARKKVARTLNAEEEGVIFTKSATEAVNLVASAFPFEEHDEIIVTEAEHHANFIPWKMTGAALKIAPVKDNGELDMEVFKSLLSDRTRLVSVAHASNVLGTIFPIGEISKLAHRKKALLFVDGAQGIVHAPCDVKELGCDFYAFSGHKIYGPTGIGVLYGKPEVLRILSPYQYGGDMVKSVGKTKIEFQDIPTRFEAGTPPIAETIGLEAALNYYLPKKEEAHKAEMNLYGELFNYINDGKNKILGTAPHKAPVLSFIPAFAHPQDVATVLAHEDVCIRIGHHCAMPLHERMGCRSTLRASFGVYNTEEDVENFIRAFEKARKMFGPFGKR